MTSTTSESSSLPDAEERSATSNLTAWLGKLKDAPYDADDLLHELSFDVFRRLLFPWSRANNYVYLPTMSSQIQVTRMKTTEKIHETYPNKNMGYGVAEFEHQSMSNGSKTRNLNFCFR
ncbi:hypothetical protein ES319_D11G379700v1 [Gossypium barbadense]|uniref:Uncharacterized protein n=2 Tax=Gossypium TaxID=3633 RepID=A0ABM3B2D4_GOSHI|nr:uncharacterized protein LOC107940439 [Gossypium hirsutum]KAB2006896.1 hypothetical protein ES319_D11G379700v1 [Gossypium barbadense]